MGSHEIWKESRNDEWICTCSRILPDLVQSEESVHSLTPGSPLHLKEVTQLVYRPQLGEQVAAVSGEEDQLAGRLGMLRHHHGWSAKGGGGGGVVRI